MPEYQRVKKLKTEKAAKNLTNRIAKNKNQYLKGTSYNKRTSIYTVRFSEFKPKSRKRK